MKRIVKKIIATIYCTLFKQERYRRSLCRWILDDGDEKILAKYPLNEGSIVFDVGGYIGVFSDHIISLYNPYIYIFEPVKNYFDLLVNKYTGQEKVCVFNIGLAGHNEEQEIVVSGETSSIFQKVGNKQKIQLIDIKEFFDQNNMIDHIDLMSINIEGGEYELLKRIIETGLINKINYLQIQFHNLIFEATEERNKLIAEILKTHESTFSYPFVWEGFKRKQLLQ